jgi:hypothetical protein
MDMPNLQTLGLGGAGGSQGGQGLNNPMGLGALNLGMPVNPAIVAAALNQAGWGLVGNIQGGQGGSDVQQSFNHPSGFGHSSAPSQGASSQQQQDNSGFIGWGGADGPGPSHQGPPNPGQPSQPPAAWPRDTKGFMKYNM